MAQAYEVRGAGSEEFNGVYEPDPHAKEKKGHRMKGSAMTLEYNSDWARWYLTEDYKGGTERYWCYSSSSTPPLSGWKVAGYGTAPAPSLSLVSAAQAPPSAPAPPRAAPAPPPASPAPSASGEVLVCASCPTFHQAAVSEICNFGKTPIVVAFGQKNDAIDRLPGDWRVQWMAKVVQATVQAMITARAAKATVIFIDSEGKSEATDEEWGMWIKLRRAIKEKYAADCRGRECELEAKGPLDFARQFKPMYG